MQVNGRGRVGTWGPSISPLRHCDPQLAFATERKRPSVCGHLPNPPQRRIDGRTEADAAWVLNAAATAAAIGKRTSKATALQKQQQPRLHGLRPVLCWGSVRSVAVRPSAGRLAGLTGAGGRSVVSLYRKAVVVVVVVVAAAAAARGSFLFSFVRVSDNGQIVCSASVAVVCGRRSSSGQVSLSD